MCKQLKGTVEECDMMKELRVFFAINYCDLSGSAYKYITYYMKVGED